MFVSPGAPAGEPGALLDRILAAIGYSRSSVHILDMQAPGWAERIRGLAPQVIVALGETAAHGLTGSDEPLSRIRGVWRQYRDAGLVCRLLPTYHPEDLLRDPALKRDVWQDMKALKTELEG
ncbi:MAG: uracil-DNA glycosylase family protein [Elusimicrobiota bacterium]